MLNALRLTESIRQGPYQAYSYSYPHKSAYRSLPSRPLREVWAQEARSALFAYIHVPFCSMRCGFCNLFAMARPTEALVESYVEAVVLQMQAMNQILGEHRFARLALGGGTPSYLSAAQLERLYLAANRILGVDLDRTPSGIEVSPETVTPDRMQLCRALGVQRVSMGIQSFAQHEVRALARPQQNAVVIDAIRQIRNAGFPIMNLDLIYGIEGQTVNSWLASIESALSFGPEELYLYPLYVREQTGLGKLAIRRVRGESDSRQELYAAARARLFDAGYRQVSMRMFRAPHAPLDAGPVYCCQDDGMVGFGAGARSYTSTLHYSFGYAVQRSATRSIIEDFIACDEAQFAYANHGFELDGDEQRRRFVIQSLLTEPGLSHAAYTRRFGAPVLEDLPQLQELMALGFATDEAGLLALNAQGVSYSDSIGPWLASPVVHRLMTAAPC